MFATTLLPIPKFGVSEEVVRGQKLPGGGLWIDEPHRVIAFGFLYFTALAISEVFTNAWVARGERGERVARDERRAPRAS